MLETVMVITSTAENWAVTVAALCPCFADEMWSSLARPRAEATPALTWDSRATTESVSTELSFSVTSISFHPEYFFQRSTCPLRKTLFNLKEQ